jgi:Bacterial regulatory helix-turn-helix protein, lysR family
MELVGLGLTGDDTFEDIGQPCHWIDMVELCRLDQRHDDGPMVRSTIGASEQGIFPRQCIGPDRARHQVGIHLDPAIIDEHQQAGPVSKYVTHTGQQVGLSQPGMSRLLGRLRGVFNDDLFVRTSTGLTLTVRGERLLEKRLPNVLFPIREVFAVRNGKSEDATSKITVAMPEHQALVLLPRLLPRLRARAPNLDVVVHSLLAGSLKRLEKTKPISQSARWTTRHRNF